MASATLSYQYSRSLVWLDELSAERDPHSYDLCDQHADRLRPPSGWHLEDRRHHVHVQDSGLDDADIGGPEVHEPMVYEPGRLAAG